jgi:hypothetical protein
MKGPKILTGCGCALVLLCLVSLAVFIALPEMTNHRASASEVLPGIWISGGCGCLSTLVLLGGVIWWVMAGRRKA